MISYKNIEINAWEHNQVQELITQGEGGIKYLYFTLYDNNGVVDLTDATEVIYSATKPDKNAVYNNLEPFDVVFDNTGKVKLKITTGMANIKGVVKGEIQVITPDGVLIFYGIDLKIEKGNGKGVESSNEFTALTKALNKIAILTPEGTVALDDELTDEGTNAVIGSAIKKYIDDEIKDKADEISLIAVNEEISNIKSEMENKVSEDDVYSISETDEKFLASDDEKNVSTKHLNDKAVTTDKIQDNAISNEKIADSAVTENKIADESVTNSKLSKNSVTTDKIKIGSVTSSKLASDAVNENVLNSDLKAKINSKLDTPDIEGIAGQVLMHTGGNKPVWGTVSGGSGGTGTSNYLELENKPSINDVSLVGNITLEELGIKNGSDGTDGVGIKSIEQTTTSTSDNGINVINIVLTDDTQSTVTVRNGSKGSPGLQGEKGDTGSAGKDGKDGVGIENIETSISSEDNGLNPIVITLTDGTEYTVYTKNGSKGSQGTSVKVKSVATSLEDDGNNIVKFTDGSTLTIKNGSKGSQGETGASGTTDYNDLSNKPKINGVELNGDIKPSDLGIKNGEDYVLTDTDKTEIANIVINEYDSSIMAILGGDSDATE